MHENSVGLSSAIPILTNHPIAYSGKPSLMQRKSEPPRCLHACIVYNSHCPTSPLTFGLSVCLNSDHTAVESCQFLQKEKIYTIKLGHDALLLLLLFHG